MVEYINIHIFILYHKFSITLIKFDDSGSISARVSALESAGSGLTDTQSTQLTAIYNEVVQHVGDMVLLWTNSSPTSSFAAQTITISGGFSSYKYLVIECYLSPDVSYQSDTNPNTEYNLRPTSNSGVFSVSSGGCRYRSATISKTNGTIVFGDGHNNYN